MSKDNINPDHYKNSTSLECIEAMEIIFGKSVVFDFCVLNAWKYIWRWKNKNGTEDLTKAMWYLDRCILISNEIETPVYMNNIVFGMRDYIEEEMNKKGA